jgi:NAD(P)-dependent dehydrogenase (short-subunit alcohol dehydrogenase family)
MSNMFDLEGKVAVVTGGCGLIGRALVEGLAASGASVYIAEVDFSAAEESAAGLTARGLSASAVRLDIRDPDSIAACVGEVVEDAGQLDVWVNSAYPKLAGSWFRPEQVSVEVWRADVDAHMNGYSFCCREAASAMRPRKQGSIVNFGSTYGMVAPDFSLYEGVDMITPATYAAIKGGIINLTRFLASYYGRDGIRVNSVSPGGIANNQPQAFVERYVAKTPLARMGTPEDIAGPVVFLASDASAYVTGHNLVVDGGFTAL